MSELILPAHLQKEREQEKKKYTVVPMKVINAIPEMHLRKCTQELIAACVESDGPMADRALAKFLMEFSMASKELEKKEAKKKKNEKSK